MSSLFLRHNYVAALWVALLVSGCVQNELPTAQSGMRGAVVELALAEPLELHLASATVSVESGTIRGKEVQLEVGAEAKTRLSGDSSTWDMETGAVVFEGNVHFSRGDLELNCDKLEGSYDGENLDRAIAKGQVVVEKGSVRARGGEALWEAVAGSITLTGSPVVEDTGRTLRGRQIKLFVDERRLECLDCALVLSGLKSSE